MFESAHDFESNRIGTADSNRIESRSFAGPYPTRITRLVGNTPQYCNYPDIGPSRGKKHPNRVPTWYAAVPPNAERLWRWQQIRPTRHSLNCDYARYSSCLRFWGSVSLSVDLLNWNFAHKVAVCHVWFFSAFCFQVRSTLVRDRQTDRQTDGRTRAQCGLQDGDIATNSCKKYRWKGCIGWRIKSGTYMVCINRAIGQFSRRQA